MDSTEHVKDPTIAMFNARNAGRPFSNLPLSHFIERGLLDSKAESRAMKRFAAEPPTAWGELSELDDDAWYRARRDADDEYARDQVDYPSIAREMEEDDRRAGLL